MIKSSKLFFLPVMKTSRHISFIQVAKASCNPQNEYRHIHTHMRVWEYAHIKSWNKMLEKLNQWLVSIFVLSKINHWTRMESET